MSEFFSSNPTPDGENDSLLGIKWPISGENGTHLDFGDELTVKNSSPADSDSKNLEKVIFERLQHGICCNSTCEI